MSLSRILANIGTALDSATTGDFLSKVDSDGVFGGVAYSSVTGSPTVLDSANVTNLVDSAYVQLRQSAVSSGGLDSAGVTAILDSDYITNITTASGFQMFEYDATAGQTDFTGSDTNGNTLAYSEYGLLVHYNGILLSGATDYTATDGTTVVLTDSADQGARITIAKWSLASAGGAGGASATWYGDRGIFGGGYTTVDTTTVEYITISTPGNATDFGDLTVGRRFISACSNSTYGVFGGGIVSSSNNEIDYFTIATTGNAQDFGDLTVARYGLAACSNATYGVFGAGRAAANETTVDYITIATTGDATDFGDLTVARNYIAACADATYGVFGGGDDGSVSNVIDYITIASTGNATDFGDLTTARKNTSATSDTTYGVFFAGYNVNTVDYITISTPSNATDFGDLSEALSHTGASSNGTYGVVGGGLLELGFNTETLEYVTIASPGNSTDFGDLTTTPYGLAACSGSPS